MPRTCRTPRNGSPRTGCWSRPTRPFLAPVPNRGKTCEPAFVADTAAFVAELRGEELEALGEATTANFFRLFGKAA